MDFKEYMNRMILLVKISMLPIDDINAQIGLLRLRDICQYEPCLQNIKEKFLVKKAGNFSYGRSFLTLKKTRDDK
jgi:hypothetical protein